MKDKILIFGKGFIGSKIQKYFNCKITDRKIFKFSNAQEEIKKYKPGIIINCIGNTGKRNIDDCELNKDRTLFANTYVPILLADVAVRNRIKLIHISSGCIYSFDYKDPKPIKEERLPDYFDLFYSRTKIYAERALEALSHRFNILIVRLRIPLDDRPHPKNILTKLIKYKKIIDIPNSVTYIPDFIKALRHLIKIDARGIFNLTNPGGLRYPQLLDVYKKYSPDFKYRIISYKELNLARTNLLLSNKKLERTGFKMRNIREILEGCVKNYVRY
jgi:3,5-epimerase/4-reductase